MIRTTVVLSIPFLMSQAVAPAHAGDTNSCYEAEASEAEARAALAAAAGLSDQVDPDGGIERVAAANCRNSKGEFRDLWIDVVPVQLDDRIRTVKVRCRNRASEATWHCLRFHLSDELSPTWHETRELTYEGDRLLDARAELVASLQLPTQETPVEIRATQVFDPDLGTRTPLDLPSRERVERLAARASELPQEVVELFARLQPGATLEITRMSFGGDRVGITIERGVCELMVEVEGSDEAPLVVRDDVRRCNRLEPDRSKPRVRGVSIEHASPAAGAVDVPIDAIISVTFSDDIEGCLTMPWARFVYPSHAESRPENGLYSYRDRKLTITPIEPLAYDTRYKFRVDTSALDEGCDFRDDGFEHEFTTAALDAGWERMQTPTHAWLSAVWGRGPDDVYAAGGDSNFPAVLMHYDGREWRIVRQENDTDLRYTGIWGDDSRVYVTTGQVTTGFFAKLEGGEWTTIARGAFHGIAGLSSRAVYALANQNLLLAYDGSTVTRLDPPKIAGNEFGPDRIWAAGAHDVFLSGHTPDGVSILRYDGSNWTQLPTIPLDGDATDAWSSNDDDIFVFARNGVDGRLSHYDGRDWVQIVEDFGGWTGPLEAFPLGPSETYLLGGNNKVHRCDGVRCTLYAVLPHAYQEVYRMWGSATAGLFVVGNEGLVWHLPPGEMRDRT